ncbi:MAG: DUF1538 domain-containing protein [Limnochordales bacterium]|nr:DUF1538 domain-containing protein [Bacillota bacterium]
MAKPNGRNLALSVGREVAAAVSPIVAIVLILHLTVAPLGLDGLLRFLGGSVLVTLGLGLFLLGVNVSVVPLGERVGAELPARLGTAGVFGIFVLFTVVATLADPNVQVLAALVDTVSEGSISPLRLVLFLAAGVGIYTLLSLLRVFFQIPLGWILVPSYALAFLLGALVDARFLSLAFDAGGVTTGPLIVPFVMALNVGIVSVLGVRDRVSASFGLVAMVFIGPILAVLLLGLLYS